MSGKQHATPNEKGGTADMIAQPAWFAALLSLPARWPHACSVCGERLWWREQESGMDWQCWECTPRPVGHTVQVTAQVTAGDDPPSAEIPLSADLITEEEQLMLDFAHRKDV